jgi:cytoskeletal protein RodZ
MEDFFTMVGDLLRAEREQQGMSISDVEKETSIRALYIESMEKGDFSALPGAAYTKGFLRNYANFLGLEADAIIAQYNSEQGISTPAAEPAAGNTAVSPASQGRDSHERVSILDLEPQSGYINQGGDSSGGGHIVRNLAIGVVAFLVLAGGAAILLGDDNGSETADRTSVQAQETKEEPQPAAPTQPAQPAQPAQPTQPAQPKAEAKPAAPEKPASDGLEISARFNDRCWTEAEVDGAIIFEGIVEKGQTMTWSGKNKVALSFGNAGAVELTENGKLVGAAGNFGEVVTKSFTKGAAPSTANAKPAAQ